MPDPTRSGELFGRAGRYSPFHAEGRHGNGTVRLVGANVGGWLMCER
jgi:hypothetical protein